MGLVAEPVLKTSGVGMVLNPIDRDRLREHVRKRLKELRRQLASGGSEPGGRRPKRHGEDNPADFVLDLKLPAGRR